MGLTPNKNTISGSYISGSQSEITIGDGITSNGQYNYSSSPYVGLETVLALAMDALSTAGGTIRLLSGSYDLTEDIYIDRDNIDIVGSGNGTIINTSLYFIWIRKTGGLEKVVIRDCQFTTDFGRALILGDQTDSLDNSKIEDCYFENVSPGLENPIMVIPVGYPSTPAPTYVYLFDDVTSAGSTVTEQISSEDITAPGAGLFPTSVSATLGNPIGYTGELYYDFDGSNDRLIHPGPPALLPTTKNTPWTFEIWINWDDFSGARKFVFNQPIILASANGWRIDTLSDSIDVEARDSGGGIREIQASMASLGITTGTWNLITISWDGTGVSGNFNLYLNGVDTGLATTSIGTPIAMTTLNVSSIGSDGNGTVDLFNGRIGHIAIWNGIALNEAQVYERYLRQTAHQDLENLNTSATLIDGNQTTTTNSGI